MFISISIENIYTRGNFIYGNLSVYLVQATSQRSKTYRNSVRITLFIMKVMNKTARYWSKMSVARKLLLFRYNRL